MSGDRREPFWRPGDLVQAVVLADLGLRRAADRREGRVPPVAQAVEEIGSAWYRCPAR